MRLTRLERETGILWNESEPTAILWSVSKAVQSRMTRRYGKPACTRGSSMEWVVPKKDVRLPVKPRKNPSAQERFKNA